MASMQDVEVQDQVPLCHEQAAVKAKRSRTGLFAGIAVACVFCGLACLSFLPFSRAEERVSVRALLESSEMAELTTDNIMAMGQKLLKPTDRANVRSHVAGKLQDIKERLEAEHPEAFKHLGDINITGHQKELLKKVLGSYGDSRMLAFTDAVRDAVRETVQAKGDHHSLKRRLTEKIMPHHHELKNMVEELFPGSGDSFNLDIEQLPVVQGYARLEAVFDVEPSAESAARRLSEEDVQDAVVAHAHTLFEALEHMLGGEMPVEPARMLSTYSSAPAGSMADPSPEEKQSFISCCLKAFPNPITVCGCIAKNISSFMSMIMGFVGGKKN